MHFLVVIMHTFSIYKQYNVIYQMDRSEDSWLAWLEIPDMEHLIAGCP